MASILSPLDTCVATWPLRCTERHKLRVFEKKILRKMFDLKREELRMSRAVPLFPLCSCMACYPERSALRGRMLQEIGESFMMRSFMKLFYNKHYSGGRVQWRRCCRRVKKAGKNYWDPLYVRGFRGWLCFVHFCLSPKYHFRPSPSQSATDSQCRAY